MVGQCAPTPCLLMPPRQYPQIRLWQRTVTYTRIHTPSAQLTNCPKNQPLWSMKDNIRHCQRIQSQFTSAGNCFGLPGPLGLVTTHIVIITGQWVVAQTGSHQGSGHQQVTRTRQLPRTAGTQNLEHLQHVSVSPIVGATSISAWPSWTEPKPYSEAWPLETTLGPDPNLPMHHLLTQVDFSLTQGRELGMAGSRTRPWFFTWC